MKRFLFAILALNTAPLLAAEEGSEDQAFDREALRANVVDRLESSANELLKKQAPFLKLNYLGNDDDAKSDGFTLDYDWSREKKKSRVPDTDFDDLTAGENQKRFRFVDSALAVHLKGSYAHDDTNNVNNLSSAGLGASIRVIDQGVLVRVDPGQDVQGCMAALDIAAFDNPADYNRALDACNQPFVDLRRSLAMPAFAYDVGFNYKVEANADYTEHQEVYGFHAGLVFEPYRGSLLQKLNIFDYPFRYLTRPLWARDDDYNASLPSLYVALDQVDPSKHTVRKALPGGADRYDRWYAELAFASQVAVIRDYPITFESNYRWYREVSAPAAVQAADLDEFEYGSVAIHVPAGLFNLGGESDFFLSYAHGRLPFDAGTEEAVAIGWKSNLKDLFGNLLE